MFCHVSSEQVFGVHDLSSVYRVPVLLRSQGILEYLTKRLKLDEVHLSKTMVEKGQILEMRWKDLTHK
jgi:CTP synthase